MGVLKTRHHIHIKIKIPNPSQEPPASCKALNQDLKNMDVLRTFKIHIESQNVEHGYIKDQVPYLDQDQDPKPESGTSRIFPSPKSRLKGYGCSFQFHNQYREPKFGPQIYQRPVTISKLPLRCQAPIRILQCPPKTQSGLKGRTCCCTFKIKIET